MAAGLPGTAVMLGKSLAWFKNEFGRRPLPSPQVASNAAANATRANRGRFPASLHLADWSFRANSLHGRHSSLGELLCPGEIVNFGDLRRASGTVVHQARVSRTVAASGRYLSLGGFRSLMADRHHSVVVALEHRPGNRLFDLVLREESVVVNPGEFCVGAKRRTCLLEEFEASSSSPADRRRCTRRSGRSRADAP